MLQFVLSFLFQACKIHSFVFTLICLDICYFWHHKCQRWRFLRSICSPWRDTSHVGGLRGLTEPQVYAEAEVDLVELLLDLVAVHEHVRPEQDRRTERHLLIAVQDLELFARARCFQRVWKQFSVSSICSQLEIDGWIKSISYNGYRDFCLWHPSSSRLGYYLSLLSILSKDKQTF